MKVLPVTIVNSNKLRNSKKQNQPDDSGKVNFSHTKESFVIADVSSRTFPNHFNISSKLENLLQRATVSVEHKAQEIKVKIDGASFAKDDSYKNFEINSEVKVEDRLDKACTVGWSMGTKTPPLAVMDELIPHCTAYLLPESSCESKDANASVNIKVSNNFKGTHIYTHYKKEKSLSAIQQFVRFIQNYASKEDVLEHEKNVNKWNRKFNLHILTGGKGERLKPFCEVNKDNKPSLQLAARHASLVNIMQYVAWKAGLIQNEDMDRVHRHHFDEDLGPVLCVLASHGYKVNPENLLLEKDKDSLPLNPKKFHVVCPADNITDIELADILENCWNKKDKVGMMVVGVPDKRAYGGLILADKNKIITEFVSKEDNLYADQGDKESYLENYIGIDRDTGKEKENLEISRNEVIANRNKVEKFGKIENPNGDKLYRGNAFIYIINPEIVPTIVSICNDKIRTAKRECMELHKYTSVNQIGEDDKAKILECLWDREVIPELVKKSNAGQLLNTDKNELKVYTYDAKCDWSDVGQIEPFIDMNIALASDDMFKGLPQKLKEAIRKNIRIQENGAKIVVLNGVGNELRQFDKLDLDLKAGSRMVIVAKNET